MSCSPHTTQAVHREIIRIILAEHAGWSEDKAHDWFHDLRQARRTELMPRAKENLRQKAIAELREREPVMVSPWPRSPRVWRAD